MKRYQVYLNSYSVSVLDEFEKISDISRSKIIRSVVDRVAQQLSLVVPKKNRDKKKYLLDELVGFIDLKTDKKTHFAENVDEIYDEI